MPVLRSREIAPLPSSETLDKGFIEPSTPSKTSENFEIHTTSTPNSHDFDLNLIPMSDPPPPPPRRSLRISSKLNSEDNSQNLISSSCSKRRRNLNVVINVEVTVADEVDSTLRVFEDDAMIEESVKKAKMGEGKEKEENGYLSLRSGVKVGKKSFEGGEDGVRKDKGKGILIQEDCEFDNGGKTEEDTLILDNQNEDKLKSSSRRRFSKEEKGKGVIELVDDEDVDLDNFETNYADKVDVSSEMGGSVEKMDVVDVRENVGANEDRAKKKMDQFKDIARRSASRFAYFNVQEEGIHEEEMAPEQAVENVVEDWPGPFSTAMKIIRDREKNSNCKVPDLNSSSVKGGGFSLVSWNPRKERDTECQKRVAGVPSLQYLCLNILVNNVDAITSLEGVPDVLRNRLCQLLCDSRKMNPHFLSLLFDGSPSEIRLADCSWLEERVFEKSFGACDTSKLTVLQLDLCGHCLSDSSLRKSLMPKGLQALTTISLKGACRVSDVGLAGLISSAPALRSMNLSQCSLLTDVGIDSIANSLGSILQELYLDECDTLDAMRILPILKRLKSLEVLSLRGIVSVSDKFVQELFGTIGHNIKELVLANCVNLTDSSLKAIAEMCPQLFVLDLSCLRKLTDIGMVHLTNGCRKIEDLKLCRCPFSDDAIAAFLEASGESLKELALNNIPKVGQNTTLALARRCNNLESLDLSWCRRLPDEALGLIADSCFSLRLLKLFGCTQISSVFVDGHSNPHLQIIGLKLTPILENIKRPDFQQGPLHYSAVPSF